MIGTRAPGVNRAPWLAAALLAARGAGAQECPLTLGAPPPPPPAVAAGPGVLQAGRIEFEGARAVSAARLRRRMQVKERRFWRPRAASVWSEERWRADHGALCDLYRERGHVAAVVGPPRLVHLPGGRPSEPRVAIHVPVREGPVYRLGALAIEGGPLFDEQEARAAFDGVVPDGPYRHALVRQGVARLLDPYFRRGYATASATITLRPLPAERVDADVSVQEGRPWFVGRILFTGNRVTRDETLRRQVRLTEGDLLDGRDTATSVRRLEELGVARVTDVAVRPSPREEGRADVTFVLAERPRLRYGLSGGANAAEGVSLSAEVAAVNARGRAERLSATVQAGPDVAAASLAFAQPGVLGSPWWAGFELRSDRLEREAVDGALVPAYEREEQRAAVAAWRPLGERSRLSASLALSRVTLSTASPEPPPGFGTRRDGRLHLDWSRDGWDHPWRPRRGLRTSATLRLSGGPLGGDTDALEGRVRAFALLPLGARGAVGIGGQGGGLRALDGGRLPFDERYLLGGQDDLRGFDLRSVGPRDASGALEGGDRYAVVQAEAHFDLAKAALRAVAFVDAGRVWAEGEPLGRRGLRSSAGLELRFELPVLRVPIRAIAAANLARDPFHPRHSFRLAVGPLP